MFHALLSPALVRGTRNNSLPIAIFPKLQPISKDIQLPKGTVINFLSTKKNVQWRRQGKDVVVALPDYDPETIKAPYACVIKIAGYGK